MAGERLLSDAMRITCMTDVHENTNSSGLSLWQKVLIGLAIAVVAMVIIGAVMGLLSVIAVVVLVGLAFVLVGVAAWKAGAWMSSRE